MRSSIRTSTHKHPNLYTDGSVGRQVYFEDVIVHILFTNLTYGFDVPFFLSPGSKVT